MDFYELQSLPKDAYVCPLERHKIEVAHEKACAQAEKMIAFAATGYVAPVAKATVQS